MKKIFFTVFLILLVVNFIHPAETDTETLLRIPVRVLGAEGFEKDLVKGDFKLYVNGELREILEFFPKSRSIAREAKENRCFVLAFNFSDYGKNIADAISHFVSNILTGNDKLIVWSPIRKIYRINVSSDKQKLAADIEKIVKEDSLAYKKNLEITKRTLDDLAMRVRLETNEIQKFINSYSREFNNFKNRFLLSDINKYDTLAAFLLREEGDKWLINFQEREYIPSVSYFDSAKRRIRTYIGNLTGTEASFAASINSGLNAIEQSMLISKIYPSEALLNMMLGLNINYNLIIFRSMRKPTGIKMRSGDYEGIFEDFAKKTGGISHHTTNLLEALDLVKENVDYYYDLIFKFNGKMEDKDIKVAVAKPETKVFYKNKFLLNEIKALVEILTEPGVEIMDYSLQGYNLKFKISGFKIDEDKKSKNKGSGIVQIELKLSNDKNEVIFRTGKVLQSKRDTINISLNLPAKFKGYFKLTIEAVDMISGRKAELNEYIKLK